ncbi:TIR domain-containing protein [Henriciella mobilis]|uniref:Thoeris protein ThsB TIR-like domain-containing protein n=1 Tax=Henriciella mobilis TaxID=2305467 RepID=A0A399RG30_9PROT|nr:TIR domain-containing protein [Henriciella mobilis]RIJ30328.1 hypothetical protein D1223_06725 [Henriciella mobilis]
MRKVFVSYHHRLDQYYKNALVELATQQDIFIDRSVGVGDIPDDWENQKIRRVIRDSYLRDSTVTILLVGSETKHRKHVDWELKSSMIDGAVNKRSGILVINLPTVSDTYYTACSPEEKAFYPFETKWISIDSRAEYERRYPKMPARIIDNLLAPNVKISVVGWNKIMQNPNMLRTVVESAGESRLRNQYDLSRTMRRNDFNPELSFGFGSVGN